MYECKYCDYKTGRLDAFKRHHNSLKHKYNLMRETAEKHKYDRENVVICGENVIPNRENVIPIGENVIPIRNNILKCAKCSKEYKNEKYLFTHEKKCKGIDNLTCPKCMRTFTSRTNKCRHMKNNKCKPVSIFEYLKRNNDTPNITHNTTNNNTTNNNITNTITNIGTYNNNIYINNYGKERKDYITFDDFLQIVKCCNNSIIPKYIKLKHFNPKFPENHNIKYEDNIFFIKRNDEWNIINSHTLSNKLFDDGGSEVYYHLNMYDDKIKNSVQNEDIYEDIKLKADYSEIEVKGQDTEVKKQLLDVAKMPITS